MEMTERKLKILHAIINDYVKSAEPVGSRALSRKFELGISPATIRNEMSDLEEMGYLTHPHTSAGRVPSDKAYRLYVNQMMERQELTLDEKREIARELQANIREFDRTIEHAARILSKITNLTSFAVTPTAADDTIKFVNLLPVDDRTVVMMIVSDTGKVSNTALKLESPCSNDNLQLLAKSMTYKYRGRTLTDVLTGNIIECFQSDVEAMDKLEQDIMPDFLMTNIFDLPEYNDIERAKSFFNLFSHKDEFIKTVINRDTGMIVTIGEENMDEQMNDYSMITATYSVDGKQVGKIGVIGPKRMRYDKITSIMEYLTDNLNQSFQLEEGGHDSGE